MGYTLVYGVLRLINFAHSEVFMIGTLGALFASRWFGITTKSSPKTGLPSCWCSAAACWSPWPFSGTTAVLLERIAYRPLRRRGAGRLAALISAIGASLFLQELVGQPKGTWWTFGLAQGRDFVPFPRLMAKSHHYFHGADFRNDKLLIFFGSIVMMLMLDRFVKLTKVGRGIRSVAQDPETAALMGVNIDRVVTVTFLLGGLMAGAAGLLYLVFIENTAYYIGVVLGIKAFTAAVLGGIGNLRGALVGGLLLGLMETYGAAIFGTQWKDPISFVLLILILMVRPTGLLGEQLGKARV